MSLWTTQHCEQVFTARHNPTLLPAFAGNMEAAGIEPAFALYHGTSPRGRKPLSHIVTWKRLWTTPSDRVHRVHPAQNRMVEPDTARNGHAADSFWTLGAQR